MPQTVFVREGSPAWDEVAGGSSLTGDPYAGAPCHVVTDRVAARIATLETAADVAAVFAAPAAPPLASLTGREGVLGTGGEMSRRFVVLYADQVSDPGNMGTLVRAAAGFGAVAVATSPGSVDLLSPKVVRASMGAVFALPLYSAVEIDTLLDGLRAGMAAPPVAAPGGSPANAVAPGDEDRLANPCGGEADLEVCGLVAHDGDDLRDVEPRAPLVLCVGAERAGLSAVVTARLTRRLTIALAGGDARGVESLNAGVAGAIALYEFSRRPRGGAAHDPQGRLQAPGEG